MNNDKTSFPHLTFYGAVGTVTGSRYCLKTKDHTVLIDCGQFQGIKEIRQRNWQPFPEPPENIDAVFLTHAHIDHSGFLPALVKNGFHGPIFCTEATADLCEVLLIDAAKIQEEDANYLNKHKLSKHKPALPLFTMEEAKKALDLFEPVGKDGAQIGDIHVNFHPNGHILGSSYLDVTAQGKHILFSGDVGRPHDIIMHSPQAPCYADYLVIESTYGDRLHPQRNIKESLADCINETIKQEGDVLIPAFAVGRAQAVIYLLYQLRKERKIPNVPIYLDSPMAISATRIMIKHHEEHRLNRKECQDMESNVHFVQTVEQSIALNFMEVPCIIVSASGMATGGRVLYHLKRLLPDSKNSVLFMGYQAQGTRGSRLVQGEPTVKIHGHHHPVKAHIENFDFLSAHADRDELMHWLSKMPVAPKLTMVTHGERDSSLAMSKAIEDGLGWKTQVPDFGDRVDL